MKRALLTLLLGASLVASLLLAAGCGSGAAPKGTVEGHEWVVTKIAGKAVSGANQLTSSFATGTVSGSTGVNEYRGAYSAKADGSMTIQLAGMTNAAGSPAATQIEAAFIKALGSAAKYETDGQTLTMSNAKGAEVLAYKLLVPTPLVGTEWHVIGISNGAGGIVAPLASAPITAVFSEDQHVTGTASVNTYRATYVVSGDIIDVQTPVTTRMSGPDAANKQEAAFLGALDSAAKLKIDGNTLALYDEAGGTLLVLKAK